MFLFFLLALFSFPFSSNEQKPRIIQYDEHLKNLTTKGGLVTDLYQLAPSNDSRPFAVRVVFITREGTPTSNPASLVLMRGKSYLSNFLPRIQTLDDSSREFYFLAETLCENRNLKGKTLTEYNETVMLTVSSSVPASYELKVKQIHGYILNMSSINVALSPSEPIFYRFSFPDFVDEISISVTSEDIYCGRVTIQTADCPVFDTEGQVVLYDSYDHQTFTKKSFLIVKRTDFGPDIHVIITVLPFDSPCRINKLITNSSADDLRVKHVTAEIQHFQPNRVAHFVLLILYFLFLTVCVLYCYFTYRINDNWNPEDVGESFNLWNMSLPALFLMTPMALVVIFKHSNLYFAKDSDTCNFNYECSISWGPVKAFNNMLSASSIIIAAIINIRLSFYFKRQRRFFPLNSCVLLTGVLWTLMNYCPQKDSFHLYTIAMIMTVLEAKFALFGIRNERTYFGPRYIGSMTMFLMVLIIFDTMAISIIFHYIMIVMIFVTNLIYACLFSYAQGFVPVVRVYTAIKPILNECFRWIFPCCCRQDDNTQVPPILSEDEVNERNRRQAAEQQQQLQQQHYREQLPLHPPSRETDPHNYSETEPLIRNGSEAEYVEIMSDANSASGLQNEQNRGQIDQEQETGLPDNQRIETGEQDNQRNRTGVQDNQRNQPTHNQILMGIYFIGNLAIIVGSILAIVIWPQIDSIKMVLRTLQCDFAWYFVLFCYQNDPPTVDKDKRLIRNWFCFTTFIFLLLIIAWGCLSMFLLPAYTRWPSAESRTLNASCISKLIGFDYHDVLHIVSTMICIAYPLMVHLVDGNLHENYHRVKF
ncbi:hypothetical protein GCK72_023367 [Caenorhabditis remanei]|uniref:Uncharacterized protein n=1 Tax=Caenorhabditis remanei TaxID=31234 RepID=A0A6A5FWY9_CAERE|nr:hypothetical protein GCK72_023367 [Caenorhabditis remanei]KAF1746909.1 hypothetical protein GCK72_023367 [Caenorhabditis remanei]